jgi:hypothetical protein
MKFVELTNTSGKRLTFPVRGADGKKLVFEPGDKKNVSPATVQHPAVSRYIGQGLEVDGDSAAMPKQKEPETAPAPPPAPPAEPTSETEPSEDEPEGDPEEPADEPAGETEGVDTKALYVSDGPGVTEDNIDAVFEKFPTVEALAEASKTALTKVGVSKSFTSRLIDWAKSQN